MTEESDDPDDSNTIIEHKLPWRSNSECFLVVVVVFNTLVFIGLNQYVELLEKRLNERVQKEYVGIVAKKVRVCGVPSACKVPENAPPWAVKKNTEGN